MQAGHKNFGARIQSVRVLSFVSCMRPEIELGSEDKSLCQMTLPVSRSRQLRFPMHPRAAL